MTIKQNFESQIDKLLSGINLNDNLLRQLGGAEDKFICDTLIREMTDNCVYIRSIANELDRLRYSL